MFDDVAGIAEAPQSADALWSDMRAGRTPWVSSAKLKLVDGCNLSCFMCSYPQKRRRGELTTAEVTTILDDLIALGCKKVHLTGGELFLRRDAVELVRYASALGLRVNLTTNATLLTKEKVKALLEARPHSITVSIDAALPALHDAVRGDPGAFKKSLKAIDLLLRYRKRKKPRVRVNTVVSRRNIATLLEFIPLWRPRPLDGWLLIPMDSVGDAEADLTPADVRYFTGHIAPVLGMEINVPGFDPYCFGRTAADAVQAADGAYARGYYRDHACYVPWFHTLVGPSGDVYPCCGGHRVFEPLGNIRDTPLRDVVRGAAYAAFREEMVGARRAACHRCDDYLVENRALAAVLPPLPPSGRRLPVVSS